MKSPCRAGGLASLTLVILSTLGGGAATATTEAEPQSAVFRAKLAVVRIGIRADATATVRCGAGTPISVKPKPLGWIGSGAIIHSDGWVATNGHVVQPFYERNEAALAGELVERAVADGCAEALGSLPAAPDRRGDRHRGSERLQVTLAASPVDLFVTHGTFPRAYFLGLQRSTSPRKDDLP